MWSRVRRPRGPDRSLLLYWRRCGGRFYVVEDGFELLRRAMPTGFGVIFTLRNLNERYLHKKALAGGGAMIDVALVAKTQRLIEERRSATGRLLTISLAFGRGGLEKRKRLRITTH